MRKIAPLLILFLLFDFLSLAREKTLIISNQSSFDCITASINNAIEQGATVITVKVRAGTYFFHERHLSLSNINNSSVSIRIIGKNALIVPVGREVSTEHVLDNYSYNSTVIDIHARKRVNVWSDLEYADSKVEVVNESTKLCRIKCSKFSFQDAVLDNAFIMITAWCRTFYYQIQRIEDAYIYFIADNLGPGIKRSGRKDFNVNNDVLYANAIPRFRVCNLRPLNVGKVYICNAQSFLWGVGAKLKSLEIKGFTFLGNMTTGDLESTPCSYMVFYNFIAESISIHDCSFIGQNSRVIALSKTDNAHINNNKFYNTFRYGITSFNSCNNTEIKNNYFEENGEDLSYDRCISCSGSNYYVANNTFKNYGYCGISVGLYYTATKEKEPSGVVEYNTLLYTEDHMKELWRYSIMDGGAIYTWTQNNKSVIRYNRIQNYGGVSFNNGIYCDDGTKGVAIYGNVISGIVNGSAIHSRRFAIADPYVGGGNVMNSIYSNFLEGGFVFEGNTNEDNHCYKGKNYILVKEGVEYSNIIVNNISEAKEDVIIPYLGENRKKIIIPKNYYKMIVTDPELRFIKRFVTR